VVFIACGVTEWHAWCAQIPRTCAYCEYPVMTVTHVYIYSYRSQCEQPDVWSQGARRVRPRHQAQVNTNFGTCFASLTVVGLCCT
jgi:hypothetical protein